MRGHFCLLVIYYFIFAHVRAISGIGPTELNIALHKPTNQSSTYCYPCDVTNTNCNPFCHKGNLAVDNNTDEDVNHNKCSHTEAAKPGQEEWWRVYLQGAFYLSEIKIFNRDNGGTRNYRKRFRGFYISGKIGSNGTELEIYKDKDDSYTQTIITVKIIEPFKSQKFSEISINVPYSTNESFVTLCEVQIMALACTIYQLDHGDVNWIHPMSQYPFDVPAGSTVRLSCHQGYNLNTPEVLECGKGGVLTLTNASYANSPQCEPLSCLPLKNSSSQHGLWYTLNKTGCFHYTCGFRLHCDKGYRSSTGNFIETYCSDSANWTTPYEYCKAVSCNTSLPILGNGDWETLNTTQQCRDYGCVYSFRCLPNYRSASLIHTTCNENGTWTSTSGKCEEIRCEEPKAIAKGEYYKTKPNSKEEKIWILHGTTYEIKTTLRVRCDEGFNLRHEEQENSSCLANGTWSNSDPECIEVTCSEPKTVASGEYYKTEFNSKDLIIKRNRGKTFKVNITLSIRCTEGYKLRREEHKNRSCLADGTWSGLEPECIVKRPTSTLSTAAVIGGSVGAVLCAIIVVLAVVAFILFRKKRSKSNDYAKRQTTGRADMDEQRVYSNIAVAYQNTGSVKPIDNSEYCCIQDARESAIELVEAKETESNSSTPRSNETNDTLTQEEIENNTPLSDNNEEYYNMTSFDKKSPTAIMLEDLVEFVLTGPSLIKKLEEQFNDFPKGLIRSHRIALKAENVNKNRYKKIYAYDDNRVILNTITDKAHNDYINATHIHGFDKVGAYVAAQGPTKDTVDDFWKMVWQEDCGKIVMLTNLAEENKMKCIQYWPNHGSHTFGSVTVILKETETFSDFVIRTIAIKQASDKQKIVRQFHFTSWPDRGVPKYASSLVNFRNKVRNIKTCCKGPTVVHCSAGIGRTGTYIALDILTEQGKSLGYVDAAACVAGLRRQRVNMVQNLDQYIFLHSTLAEALMLSSSAIPASQFAEVYRELLQIDPVKRRRNIDMKFEMLKHMSPVADENQYISAREVRNKKRNRYSNILPVSDFMPVIKGSTKDGYINAVYLPSYKEKRALILTQMPLENTKADFWALIQEQSVHTIVMLNNKSEAEAEEIYWPEVGESQTFNNYDIESLGEESVGHHTVVTLQLIDNNTEKTVKLVQCLYWPTNQALPNSPSDIIGTIDLVQKLQQQSGNHPLVVHCMNGVDRSGLFCVISAVIERLKIEQDVAITQVIEQMRCCRDQIIPSVEQFQFCHEVILAYIQQFNEYSNFSAI